MFFTLCGALPILSLLLLSACTAPPAEAIVEETAEPAVELAAPSVELAPPDLDDTPVDVLAEASSGEAGGQPAEAPTEIPTLDPAELELAEAALGENISMFLASMADHRAVTPTDINKAIEARNVPFLVDVRCQGDILAANSRYIGGAIVVPLQLLAYNTARLPTPDTPIVVYGNGDTDAAIGTMTLAALGYTDVRAMVGGSFKGWAEAGYPSSILIAAGPG